MSERYTIANCLIRTVTSCYAAVSMPWHASVRLMVECCTDPVTTKISLVWWLNRLFTTLWNDVTV